MLNGATVLVDGTSAATPVVASAITFLNIVRAQQGKSPLGFITPLLYAHPSVASDIISGGNIPQIPGSGYGYGYDRPELIPPGTGCGPVGYSAVPGWDPASGLGALNYPKLFAVVQTLP